MLEAIGASELEDRIYRHLAAGGPGTLESIAGRLGIATDQATAALTALERLELVRRSESGSYLPAPPGIAVDALLLDRQRQLHEARVALAELTEDYRSGVWSRTAADVIEVVADPEALRRYTLSLRESAAEELCALMRPPWIAVGVAEAAAQPPGPDGVRYRYVFDRQMLELPSVLDSIRGNRSVRQEDRVHAAVPMKLLIADSRVALLPLARAAGEAAPAGIVVHPSALLDALIALFELVWTASVPLRADDDPGGPIEPGDARVLALLLAGLTDESIAAQLDTSVRTVQRRVRMLMDLAGVQTRIQLGWHAARHQWL
jgi:DNA-binding CsgD family transcriptional regulator